MLCHFLVYSLLFKAVSPFVDASKLIPLCLIALLRMPWGKRKQIQTVNSVIVKQKSNHPKLLNYSQTYLTLLLDGLLLRSGLAAVFVAIASNHPKLLNWMFTCYLCFKIDFCALYSMWRKDAKVRNSTQKGPEMRFKPTSFLLLDWLGSASSAFFYTGPRNKRAE